MNEATVFKQRLLNGLLPPLEAAGFVAGCWEGGAAATGRADEYSDLDLCVVAAAERAPDVFALLEATLVTNTPITHTWRVEPPPFPGMAQRFYFLAGAPRFFAVDCAVLTPEGAAQFLERERHGKPIVLFDRAGQIAARPLDRAAHDARMWRRFEQIRASWPVYRMLVDKELTRGRHLDAFGFYVGGVLRLLVELTGMRFRPDRFDYGWRYLHHDLPSDVQAELRSLAWGVTPELLPDLLPRIDTLATRLTAEIEAASRAH